jgi:plasmid stability protein
MYAVCMSNIQYTIRNIPDDLDKKLRQRSKKSGLSFNKTLLQALNNSVNNHNSKTNSDIDWLYGSGGIGAEEQQAFSKQRGIDKKAWGKN